MTQINFYPPKVFDKFVKEDKELKEKMKKCFVPIDVNEKIPHCLGCKKHGPGSNCPVEFCPKCEEEAEKQSE